MELFANIVGNIGVICFLVAYYVMQKGVTNHTHPTYLSLNLVGALLVMFSLLIEWNLSAFLLEAAWAIITLYGMYQHLYLPWRSK